MSRTYRKTSTKQGMPRSWASRDMARKDHRKAVFTKPYGIKPDLYETRTQIIETKYISYCPKGLRTYVSSGTPHALEELGPVITYVDHPSGYGRIAIREPSKWYTVPPDEFETHTRKYYVGPNPDYNWDDRQASWEQEYLFDFVRKNKSSGRKRKTHAYHKRQDTTAARRAGKIHLNQMDQQYPDQLRSDVMNIENEPYHWLFDDEQDWHYESHWDDWLDRHDEPEDDDYDAYDFYYDEPMYDDWDYWHCDDY